MSAAQDVKAMLTDFKEGVRWIPPELLHRPRESLTRQEITNAMIGDCLLSVEYATPSGVGYELKGRTWQVISWWIGESHEPGQLPVQHIYINAVDQVDGRSEVCFKSFWLERIVTCYLSTKIVRDVELWYPACWEMRKERHRLTKAPGFSNRPPRVPLTKEDTLERLLAQQTG